MTVDCHAHISPPESVRRFPMPPSLGDVEGMIQRKLELGVERSIVGSPVGAGAMAPVPGVDNYAQSVDRLRAFHDWLARTVAAHPQHLSALVYANPFGDDAHLTAAAETLVQEEFVGFIVNTSVSGRYLDDARCDQFFALAAERNAPVVLHAPAQPAAGTGLSDPRLTEQVGRFGDVTAGVACVIFGGWLDTYPDLRLVATAGGGALALVAEKLDLAASPRHWGRGMPPAGDPPRQLSRPPSDYLRGIWVDTATPSATALRANLNVFAPERTVFGTDSPPLTDAVSSGLAAVDALPLTGAQIHGIRHDNAVRLFGVPGHSPGSPRPPQVPSTAL